MRHALPLAACLIALWGCGQGRAVDLAIVNGCGGQAVTFSIEWRCWDAGATTDQILAKDPSVCAVELQPLLESDEIGAGETAVFRRHLALPPGVGICEFRTTTSRKPAPEWASLSFADETDDRPLRITVPSCVVPENGSGFNYGR